MLRQVRGALKGVAAWFIVILLILAFALFGVPEVRNMTANHALKVGNEGFSAQEITEEFNRAIVSQRSQSGGDFTREDAISSGVPAQVISSLATRSALEQEARNMGLTIPRSLVSDFLRTNDAYKNPRTGKFDQETLQSILRNFNLSVRGFEEILKKDLLRGQLIDAIVSPSTAPKAMVDSISLRESERRNVSFIQVTEEMAGVAKEPTPEDLRSFYDKNQTRFTAPEYRTFTTVMLRRDDFANAAETPEEELRAIYEANRERLYEKPERRTIYQITYDTETAAAAAIAKLNDGAPIEQIATDRGLTLDAITFTEIEDSAILDPNVKIAAFDASLTEGSISAPIESLFGYTLVQVAGIIPPETQSFEEVRPQIEEQFKAEGTRKKLYEAVETIESERDVGTELSEAAKTAGIDAKIFGPVDSFSFGQSSEIIADIPGEVLREAFLLIEGEESEALEFEDDTGYFFIVVNEVIAPAPIPLEKVSNEVDTGWRQNERDTRIENTMRQIRDAVAGGATFEEAAKPFSAIVETIFTSRRAFGAPFTPQLVQQVFAADLGTTVSGDSTTAPALIFAKINEIAFDGSTISAGDEVALKQYLSVQLDQEIVDAYAGSVQNDLGITRNENAIDAIFSADQ